MSNKSSNDKPVRPGDVVISDQDKKKLLDRIIQSVRNAMKIRRENARRNQQKRKSPHAKKQP